MQKISKFKRKDKSNGIPLLQHGFFFSFTKIFQNTFTNILYNFFFMLFSYFQNNECKKNSKFERDDKSNGIPLVQHGFFFPFHENFPTFIQKLSLQFFIIVCSYFQHNECKEISKFERKTRAMESHFFTIVSFFLSRQFSYMNIQGEDNVQHVLYGIRKRPSHGKSVPRKKRPKHVKYVRGASSDFSGASSK